MAPGAERIAVASSRDRLKAVGFRNPDGMLVVVVLNQAEPWSSCLRPRKEDYGIPFWLQVGTPCLRYIIIIHNIY